MKNFADVPNSVGSWPNVTAQNCTGPGNKDGTAHVAETVTDYWGWMQALLSDQSLTPNDLAESASASQILDALRMLSCNKDLISPAKGCPNESPSWAFLLGYGRWESRDDSVAIIFPLELPPGLTVDLEISFNVDPGAARSGTDRMSFRLIYLEYGDTSPTVVGSAVYDDGTASKQDVVLQSNSLVTSKDRRYFAQINAGNTGGSSYDYLYSVKRTFTLS